jgi:mannose-6-phosphate isomerase-like protein (cupin superfamily)
VSEPRTAPPPLLAFPYGEVARRRRGSGEDYVQFLNAGSLSLGLYELAAGATDPQQPHAEDEVYYVVAGRAKITVAGETIDVAPGDSIFVAAHAEHRFHDIAEDLSLLVFFAPEHRR